MASVTAFIEGRLRLKVNQQNSAVARVEQRTFLGHRLLPGGRLGVMSKTCPSAWGAEKPQTGKGQTPATDPAQPGHGAGADDRGGEQLHLRVGDVLPLCRLHDGSRSLGQVAAPQTALRPS